MASVVAKSVSKRGSSPAAGRGERAAEVELDRAAELEQALGVEAEGEAHARVLHGVRGGGEGLLPAGAGRRRSRGGRCCSSSPPQALSEGRAEREAEEGEAGRGASPESVLQGQLQCAQGVGPSIGPVRRTSLLGLALALLLALVAVPAASASPLLTLRADGSTLLRNDRFLPATDALTGVGRQGEGARAGDAPLHRPLVARGRDEAHRPRRARPDARRRRDRPGDARPRSRHLLQRARAAVASCRAPAATRSAPSCATSRTSPRPAASRRRACPRCSRPSSATASGGPTGRCWATARA